MPPPPPPPPTFRFLAFSARTVLIGKDGKGPSSAGSLRVRGMTELPPSATTT